MLSDRPVALQVGYLPNVQRSSRSEKRNSQDIFKLHCESMGFQREDPILYSCEKVKKVMREVKQSGRQFNKTDYLALKKNVVDEVSSKMVPDDVLNRYMIRTMDGPSSLWRMRKQFALQHAANCFMTFVFFMSSRGPAPIPRFTFYRAHCHD
ncbi:MAG: hypothetical protein NXY57DRAFT_440210 [Lentinula lateritia]|nr:MAG: hypothetical protein NXY57DRAFT_440210 [Lentinula lateritia]